MKAMASVQFNFYPVGTSARYCLQRHQRIGHNKKANQSHYRPEVPRVFQEVKVPRLRDNVPGWW